MGSNRNVLNNQGVGLLRFFSLVSGMVCIPGTQMRSHAVTRFAIFEQSPKRNKNHCTVPKGLTKPLVYRQCLWDNISLVFRRQRPPYFQESQPQGCTPEPSRPLGGSRSCHLNNCDELSSVDRCSQCLDRPGCLCNCTPNPWLPLPELEPDGREPQLLTTETMAPFLHFLLKKKRRLVVQGICWGWDFLPSYVGNYNKPL